jgi:hypothetical protein
MSLGQPAGVSSAVRLTLTGPKRGCSARTKGPQGVDFFRQGDHLFFPSISVAQALYFRLALRADLKKPDFQTSIPPPGLFRAASSNGG